MARKLDSQRIIRTGDIVVDASTNKEFIVHTIYQPKNVPTFRSSFGDIVSVVGVFVDDPHRSHKLRATKILLKDKT